MELILLVLAGLGGCYAQIITTVAGTDTLFLKTPMPALQAPLKLPAALAVDRQGNLFFADSGNSMVMRVSPDGMLTVVAGTGSSGYSGDGGPATSASLAHPQGVAVDAAGNVYIADTSNGRIRQVTPDGVIRTVPGGTGNSSFPARLALDAAGNLYITESPGVRLLKLTPAGTMSTVVDGLQVPAGVAIDNAGNMYVAEASGFASRIRKITPDGTVTTVAGGNISGALGDGGPGTSAKLIYPKDVALDGAGNLYIADSGDHLVREVTSNGIITTVAGQQSSTNAGDGGPATKAWLDEPIALAVDPAGSLYIGDAGAALVRKVNPAGSISTVAGSGYPWFFGDGGVAIGAQLSSPTSVAVDAAGNLFVADAGNNRVRKVTRDGMINTVAGNGQTGPSGDGGAATSVALAVPFALALDSAGNLYIAERGAHRIRKVTPAGTISTVAGTGSDGFSGDGGPATQARLWTPVGVALDGAGNLYIADSTNFRVRKVTPAGVISTIAGNGSMGFSGDGGPATQAQISDLNGVAADTAGNVYIADRNRRVRKVTPAGIISTFAGTGQLGSAGDGGPATMAQLSQPVGLAVDGAGNVYIVDAYANRIRKVTPAGVIGTVAGNGNLGGNFSGDGGLATSASLDSPQGITVDAGGNLYIADTGNNRVRKVSAETYTGTVKPKVTAVMNGASYGEDIAPNTWITVTGTYLSQTTRTWGSSDFVANQLPVQLDGVRVFVNGIAAAVSYISPTQINALVNGNFPGPSGFVPVEILTPQGRSDPFAALMGYTCAPALFTYSAEGGKYVIAYAADGTFIGKPGLVPGLVTRPAHPGEVITVFGTGFGQTDPPFAPGTVISAPLPMSGYVNLYLDGHSTLSADWVGLTGAGLYQMNVTMPLVLSDGDHKVRPMASGGSGKTDAWITVQN